MSASVIAFPLQIIVRLLADLVGYSFFVAVTATFQLLHVFVGHPPGLGPVAVTADPTAAWTLQQVREAVGFEQAHRYLVHDRDSIFAASLDESIKSLGLTVLNSPPHSPKANAICEPVIGTICTRVLGLVDSVIRTAPATDAETVGDPSQRSAPA